MFHIPDINQTPFHELDVEIDIDFAVYAPEAAAQLRAAFAGKPFDIAATIEKSPDVATTELSARVVPGLDSLSVRLAVIGPGNRLSRNDLNALSALELEGESRKASFVPHQANATRDRLSSLGDFEAALRDRLAVIDGAKGARIKLDCCFGVDRNDLPPNGIVRRGLGAQARFGEDVLTLAGARFVINSDPSEENAVEYAISWFLRDEFSGYDVEGTIEFVTDRDLYPSLLLDIVQHARDQFNRYILEHDRLVTS